LQQLVRPHLRGSRYPNSSVFAPLRAIVVVVRHVEPDELALLLGTRLILGPNSISASMGRKISTGL